MARVVLGAVGAVVGFFIGGPTGAQIGFSLGYGVGNYIDTPRNNFESGRIGDLKVTGTNYGQTIPWVAGAPRLAGQIVWASNRRETATTRKVAKKTKVTTYTYDVDLLILLSENEIQGVSRIWVDGELIYSDAGTKQGVWSRVSIYTGASDQLPDPTYEAAVGAGNAPAYRTRGSVFIEGLQLGESGRIPNITFELGQGFIQNAVVKNDVVLLVPFEDQGSNDISTYSHGTGSIVNGTVTSSGFLINYSTHPNTSISWASSNFNNTGTIPITYEFTFTYTVTGTITSQPRVFYYNSSQSGSQYYAGIFTWSGNWYLEFVGQGGTQVSTYTTVQIPAPNTSTKIHVVVQNYTNGTVQIFINGILVKTATHFYSPASFGPNTPVLSFGGDTVIAQPVTITIDDIRITKAILYDANNLPQSNTYLETSYDYFDLSVDLLKPVINRINQRALLDEMSYDVSEIDDSLLVKGLAISQVLPTRNVLEVLKSAYLFDIVSSDKIYFTPRNNTVRATISYAELGTNSQNSDQEPFSLKTNNEIEIPSQIAITYNNVLADYQQATEYSDRLISSQVNLNTIELNLGLTPSEAKQIANAIMNDQIATITGTDIRVPIKYAYLQPNDVIEVVNSDGKYYTLRIVGRRDFENYLEFGCVLSQNTILKYDVVADEDYVPTEINFVSDTTIKPLDIPLLRDVDDDIGYYLASRPTDATKSWSGAVLMQSYDDVFYEAISETTTASTAGICDTILGNFTDGNVFDEYNTLTVTVNQELSSVTRTELYNNFSINTAVVGKEIIRFMTAELVSPNVYRLSSLLRGQRGTEQHIATHVVNEDFVLLDAGSIRRIENTLSEVNTQVYLKGVTYNLLASSADTVTFQNTAISSKPFSPVDLRVLKDLDTEDFNITWIRRTRLSYNYFGSSGGTVPLGQLTERYRLRFYDGSTLVRTTETTSPSFVYTSAMQAADGFTTADTFTVEVMQLSDTIGEGFKTTAQGTL